MKKILILIVCALVAITPAVAQKTLPQGMTQEQYDKIQAQLPQGVTVEMVIANLPEGMTLEQALKIMAAQQAEKAKEAQAAQQTGTPQAAAGAGATAKSAPNKDAGSFEFIPYAGLNLGMTTSIGVPRETRSISVAPYNFNFAVGFLTSKRFCKNWGMMSGLRVERKGGNSNVYMENYYTKVHFDGATEETQGYYTGRSQGHHDVYALTLPLYAMYQPSQKWSIQFGPYFSWQFSRNRHGESDRGYIRQSVFSPLIPVDHSQTDNSKKVSEWDCGVSFGCTRQLWSKLYMVFDFNWGLVNQWDGTDYGMKMDIFNIYGQLGFGWKFNTGKKK